MLTQQDLKMIKTCVKSVFEEDIVPSLTQVFATKADLKQELKLEFEKYDRKMDVRFERLEKRMDYIEERMDERFARVDERFAQIDERFNEANERMQEMQSTLNNVHLKLDEHIEDTSLKLNAHLRRIHALQGIPVSDKPKVAYTTSTARSNPPKPKPKK